MTAIVYNLLLVKQAAGASVYGWGHCTIAAALRSPPLGWKEPLGQPTIACVWERT